MKKIITEEILRAQKIAGIISESQYNESLGEIESQTEAFPGTPPPPPGQAPAQNKQAPPPAPAPGQINSKVSTSAQPKAGAPEAPISPNDLYTLFKNIYNQIGKNQTDMVVGGNVGVKALKSDPQLASLIKNVSKAEVDILKHFNAKYPEVWKRIKGTK